jgi:hypothetical protein
VLPVSICLLPIGIIRSEKQQTQRYVMKVLVTAAVLATVVASPALAQSYDPSIGSGNIVPYVGHQSRTFSGALPNYARLRLSPGRSARRANPYAAYGAVTRFGSGAGRSSVYRPVGRRGVVGKDHGPNGW